MLIIIIIIIIIIIFLIITTLAKEKLTNIAKFFSTKHIVQLYIFEVYDNV